VLRIAIVAAQRLPDPRDLLIADLLRRVEALEARLPSPRWTPPSGWVSVKQASFASGFSSSTIYRRYRRGAEGIRGMTMDKRVILDPASLPRAKKTT
jgi:hypothetical protein